MTKPIFTIGVPYGTPKEQIVEIQENLAQSIKQYYIVVYTANISETIFNCFFEKDFDEVKFEELKQLVQNKTTNQNFTN